MKNTILISLALTASALGQGAGPLAPPGPPADGTYRTLGELWDKVEPLESRTDVLTLPAGAGSMHTISAPGSYFLSANLDVTASTGIRIESDRVTLDLGGFTISRSSSADVGVFGITIVGELDEIVIRDGNITSGITYDPEAEGNAFTGSGFAYGIYASGSTFSMGTGRISRVNVSGCSSSGIQIYQTGAESPPANVIEHCIVRDCRNTGIAGVDVHHCIVSNCGSDGIRAVGAVTYCRAEAVGTMGFGGTSGSAIRLARIVSHCVGISEQNFGILADEVSHSFGASATTTGISATTVSYSHGKTTGSGVGIAAQIAVACTAEGGETITNKYLMP